jgi:hypothetical protein
MARKGRYFNIKWQTGAIAAAFWGGVFTGLFIAALLWVSAR